MAGICTRYISYLYYHNDNATEKESKASTSNSTDNNGVTEDLSSLAIYNDCQQHYPRLALLTCILQMIAIFCPGALVWSIGTLNKGSGSDSSMHQGSPLDYLPGSICQLPGLELLETRLQKQVYDLYFFYIYIDSIRSTQYFVSILLNMFITQIYRCQLHLRHPKDKSNYEVY